MSKHYRTSIKFYGGKYLVRLYIGNQSFDIDRPRETKQEAEFLERMIGKALDKYAERVRQDE